MNSSVLESEHVECRPQGQAMEVPDHNGLNYQRGPQNEVYRSRGQLQRHHTIQTCDDAYVSKSPLRFLRLHRKQTNLFVPLVKMCKTS